MSKKLIFPVDIVEYTTEQHFFEHNNRSKIIYLTVLLALVAAFISLFFLRASVSVNGGGILTSANERNTIKAPVSGRIDQVYVKLNQEVKAGDTLFSVQTNILEEQSDYLVKRKAELHQRIGDLQKLTQLGAAIHSIKNLPLQSPVYRQQFNLYRQQYLEAHLQLENARTIYQRNKILHDKKVLSDAEFDKFNFDYQTALSKQKLLDEQQISQWHTDLNNLRTELMDLSSQNEKFEQERDLYTVRAPIDGSVQQLNSISPGSFVSLGESVAELSPSSGLIATVNVAPKDIGLLQLNMPVNIQIDAFNYNEWGMAKANVIDISKDVYIDQDRIPMFQVKCKLKKHSLYLMNGYEGRLKKGMSFQARFQVTKRTLFQLLYDKVDDWLNPARRSSSSV
jgi:HlyD family secretion protein